MAVLFLPKVGPLGRGIVRVFLLRALLSALHLAVASPTPFLLPQSQYRGALPRQNLHAPIFLYTFHRPFMNFFLIPPNLKKNKNGCTGAALQAVRTRFAPSPSGLLHVGGVRTALFNWLLAQHYPGSALILRIEDTNPNKIVPGAEAALIEDLKWLGLSWKEGPDKGGPFGPYKQSERLHIYRKLAQTLVGTHAAYYSYEDEEMEKKSFSNQKFSSLLEYPLLPSNKSKVLPAIRFRIPKNHTVMIQDIVRGEISWNSSSLKDDFIILRSNGLPVYNFCAAVDDALMNISHVIRGEEHLSNTLRQILILQALNYSIPMYGHCSLIVDLDRQKLSKRRNEELTVKSLRKDGYLPEAIINTLALLGWNDGSVREFYSTKDLIHTFSPERFIKSSAVFDKRKLKWFNFHHLKALSDEKFYQKMALHFEQEFPLFFNSSISSFSPRKTVDNFLHFSIALFNRSSISASVEFIDKIHSFLNYPLEKTLFEDPTVYASLSREAMIHIFSIIINDYYSHQFPFLHPWWNTSFYPSSELPPHSPQKEKLQASLHFINEERAAVQAEWQLWRCSLQNRLPFLAGKQLWHSLRIAMSGRMSGPDVGQLIRWLTKAEILGISSLIPLHERMFILEKVLHRLKQ